MFGKPLDGEQNTAALIRACLVAAFVVLIPLALLYLLEVDAHSPHIERRLLGVSTFGPLDVISIMVAAAALPLVFRRDTYERYAIGLIGIIAFVVITAIAVAAEPSAEGVLRIVRLSGAAGVVVSVRWMSPSTYMAAVVWPLTASVLIQAPWALLQTFVWGNGHESAITARFDHAWTHGYGTMDGGYALAAFVVLAIAIILGSGAFRRLHPLMWVAVVVGSASIATSFGRQAVLAALAIAFFYGLGFIAKRRWEYVAGAVATVVPMTLGIWRTWVGWSVRASETAAGFQSGRESMLERAFTVIGRNPLTGVGPGRYPPYLAEIGLTPTDATIVHNVPVLITAEYGIPIGVLFTLWIGLVGLASVFTSFRAMAIFAVVAPYLLFDHPHVVYGYGVASMGVWLAALEFHRRNRTEPVLGRPPAAETHDRPLQPA